MEEQLPDGSRVFRASWRSVQAMLVAWTFIGVVAGMLIASPKVPLIWPLFVPALLIAGWCWWLVRPILKKLPVVQVGPKGVSGHGFRGQTVPWADVENIEQRPYQGQNLTVLILREGSTFIKSTRSMYSSGRRRHLPLALLTKQEREQAGEAVLQAFHQYGGEQAQAAVQAVREEGLAHEAFEQRLRAKTPSLWALYAVVALNLGVWVANLADGMGALQPETADLFRWGANSASAVVRDGEWWRLLSATVLHGGLVHLALNLWALWVAGAQVCRWFGNGPFLLIYWGSALAGSALSLHFSAQQSVSVGASGAVFGVLGALLAGVFQHRDRVPKALVTQLLTSQGLFVAISLVQGFTRPGIDNAAHVGGLLAGVVMAWLLVELVDEQASVRRRRAGQLFAVVVVALGVAGLVATARPGVDHRALFETQALLREVLPRFHAAEAALQQDARAEQAGRLSAAQLIDALERRHIPAYRAVGADLARLNPAMPSPRLDELRGLQAGVLELMTLEVGKARGTLDPAQADRRMTEVSARLQALNRRLRPDGAGDR